MNTIRLLTVFVALHSLVGALELELKLNADFEVFGVGDGPVDGGQTTVTVNPGGKQLPNSHPPVREGASADACPSDQATETSCASLYEIGQHSEALECSRKSPESTSGDIIGIIDALEFQASCLNALNRQYEALELLRDALNLREAQGGEVASAKYICNAKLGVAMAGEGAALHASQAQSIRLWAEARLSWKSIADDERCSICHKSGHVTVLAATRQAVLAHAFGDFSESVRQFAFALSLKHSCNVEDEISSKSNITLSYGLSLLEHQKASEAVDLLMAFATQHGSSSNALLETITLAVAAAKASMGDCTPLKLSPASDAEIRAYQLLFFCLHLSACDENEHSDRLEKYLSEAVQNIEDILGREAATIHPIVATAKRILR